MKQLLQLIPGKGVSPEDSAQAERIAVDLSASWDNLIFSWMIISCTGGVLTMALHGFG